METSKKKKYLLFKSTTDGGPKPCAFFVSPAGCRNGDKCQFSHEIAPAKTSAPVATPVFKESKTYAPATTTVFKESKTYTKVKAVVSELPASGVSTSSKVVAPTLSADEHKKLQKEKHVSQRKENKKARAAATTPIATPNAAPVAPPNLNAPIAAGAYASFAMSLPVAAPVMSKNSYKVAEPPAPAPALAPSHKSAEKKRPPLVPVPMVPTPQKSAEKKRMRSEVDDDSDFLFGAVNEALRGGLIQSPPGYSTTPNIAPMHSNITNGAGNGAMNPPSTKKQAYIKNASVFASNESPFLDGPAALSAVRGRSRSNSLSVPAQAPLPVKPQPPTWMTLVEKTHAHARYANDYRLRSPEHDSTWVRAKEHSEWNNKQDPPVAVLAIDCEMCQTTDPVTGEKEHSALVRLSVINGLNSNEVVLDSLVKPSMPVSDWRTNIHGISNESMNGVFFTLRHAQAAMMKMCSDQTILVGHALHHDLKALKFCHQNVIDTAYLYEVQGEVGMSPSVRDIAENVLSQQMTASHHDSIEDARAALLGTIHILQQGLHCPIPVARISPIQRLGSVGDSHCCLLAHRLPANCTEEHVTNLFLALTHIVPVKSQPFREVAGNTTATDSQLVPNSTYVNAEDSSSGMGRTTVQFHSKAHAELAFNTLPGPNRPDKQNRSQKRVYLKGGGYINIRKNYTGEVSEA